MAKRKPWHPWFIGAGQDDCERDMETGRPIAKPTVADDTGKLDPLTGPTRLNDPDTGCPACSDVPCSCPKTDAAKSNLPGVTWVDKVVDVVGKPEFTEWEKRRQNLIKRLGTAPKECEFALVEILAVPNRPGVFGVGVFATVGKDYQTDVDWANKALAYGLKATGKTQTVSDWNDVRDFKTEGNC